MSDEHTYEDLDKDALFTILSETERLANVGGWEWDIVRDVWTFSDNWLRIHGCSKRHLTTSDLLPIAHPDDRKDIQKAFDRAVTEGNKYEIEHRIIGQDTGEERYVRAFGMPKLDGVGKAVKLFGSAQDITERRCIEDEVKSSEQKFRSLAENVPGLVLKYRLNKDGSDELLYISKSVEDIFEVAQEDAFKNNKLLWDRIHENDLEEYIKTIKVSADNLSIWEQEHRLQFPDGRVKWLYTRGVPAKQDDDSVIWDTIALEITEQKKVEALLRESEERYRNLYEDAAIGIFHSSFEGRFLDVNPALARMLGYETPQEVVDSIYSISEQIYVEPQARDEVIAQSLANGETVKVENRYFRKDGSEWNAFLYLRYISDTNGQPLCLEGFVEDITDRKRAEEALQKSESKYRMIAENMADIITTMDMNLRFTYVSPSIIRLRGFTVAEALEQTIDQIMTPESLQRVTAAFADELRLEEAGIADPDRVRTMELEEYKKDGSTIWVENKASFIRDEGGKPVGILVISRDISDRKKAEDALRESVETYRALVEGIPDTVMRFDREGRHLFVSDNVRETVDIEPKRFIGKTHAELGFPEEQCRFWEESIRRVFDSGAPFETEFTFEGKAGNVIFDWRLLPERDAQGVVSSVLSISRDITAHRKAEQEYQTLFRKMLEGFALHEIILDVDGTPVDYRFLSVNPAFERMTGLKSGDIVGRTVLEVLPGTERHWIESYGKVALTGEPVQFENHSAELGKHFEVTAFRPVEGQFACIFQDITERKQAELALLESETRFKALHNASFGGIAIHDQGVILECNQGLSEMMGYKYSELIGMNGLLLISEKSRKKVTDNIRAGYEKPYEAFGLRKNGEEFPMRLEARNVPYKGKQVRTVEFRDLTEQKQAEAEKEKLQAQLSQAQKMESVGRLAGGVAHDFNNMLNIILGNTEMAMEDMAPDHPLQDTLEEIFSAAERSADITRQLLAFSRKQTIAPKVIDLNATIESMLRMLRRLIGEDIDLAWLPGANIRQVRMDPSQIDQIMANLCVNARDAIADVGKITIETGNTTFDSAYCATHPGFEAGDFVLLAVSDDGCGMDQETLASLFEPFFSTKDVGKGTGLGLATVYGIVKQNNGFINVYSEPGQGTTFRIYLPQYRAETESPKKTTADKIDMDGNETILLVEDEPSILRMTRMMLERNGYKVLAAGTPGEAISLAREHAGQIHLLMTDVVMPEMNGRDLAKNLLSLYPKLKRLFMSGYTANVIAHHGVLDEGVKFIQKPFSKKNLAIKVREALDEDNCQMPGHRLPKSNGKKCQHIGYPAPKLIDILGTARAKNYPVREWAL